MMEPQGVERETAQDVAREDAQGAEREGARRAEREGAQGVTREGAQGAEREDAQGVAREDAQGAQDVVREDAQTSSPARTFEPSFDAPRIDASAFPEDKPEEKPSMGERAKGFALDKTPQKLKNPSDLQVRLRTGAIYIAVTTLCLLAGNIPTAIMLAVTVGICAGELFFMLRHDAKLPNEALGIIGAVCYPLSVLIGGVAGAAIVTVLLMVALVVWYVFWQRARFSDVAVSFFGAMYTGLLLSSVLFIRMHIEASWGGLFVWCIFVSIWACDGLAYLVGRKIGKHKMAPRVSPKKSWEGFIAGEITCVVVWVGMSFIPGVNMGIGLAVLFGIVVGIAGVLGDLVESRIKRNSGVKDSGTLMPGHGGLLDRSDSMFLASIVAAILLFFFGCF